MPVTNRPSPVVVHRRRHHRERRRVGEAQQPDAALAELEQMPIDRIAPHRIGQVALELRRARAQHHAAPLASEPLQLEQQTRLADPRLALDHHNPAPRACGGKRRHQRLALTHAPDERVNHPGPHTRHCLPKRHRSDR